MKRRLRAAAFAPVAFCLCAGQATAQTSTTLFGIVDAGLAYEDKGAPGATGTGGKRSLLVSGGQAASRLGFKGSEDLGGGLSAIYLFTSGFFTDDGNLGMGGRRFVMQSVVGLRGGLGTIKLGRQNTPMRTALEAIDPFGFSGITGTLEFVFSSNGGFFRMDNAVSYATPPTLGGYFGQAAYGFGEVAGDVSASRQTGWSGGYAKGDVTMVAAGHAFNGDAATGGSNRTRLIGATYDFHAFKAHFGHAWNRADTIASGITADSRDLMIGLSAPLGPHTLMATYVLHKDDLVAHGDFRHAGLGYVYSFSNQVSLYASVARTGNGAAGTKNVDKPGERYLLAVTGMTYRF